MGRRFACARDRLLTGFCVALSSTGCGAKHAPAGVPPAVVSVAIVGQKDVPVYSEYAGTLDANVNSEARARVKGILLEQHFTEGAAVKAGQLLFVIDPKPYQAAKLQAEGALAQAKAALEKANADVARDTPLVEKQAVSKQDLDNAIAARDSAIGQVAAAQGQLDNAVLDLGYTRVTSPIDGIAGIAQVRIGNLVGQDQPTLLTTVSQVDPIRLVWPLGEREYITLAREIAAFEKAEALGQPHVPQVTTIQLVLADGSVFPYRGHVAIVGTQVNPATGTLTVQAFFPNPDQLLRPGQYGRVRFRKEISQAVVVPQRAVAQLQGQNQVAVVGPQERIAMRVVRLGPESGAFVVVEDGLKPGERFVFDGVGKVRAGEPVTAKPADTSGLPLESAPYQPEKGAPSAPSGKPGVTAPQPTGSTPAAPPSSPPSAAPPSPSPAPPSPSPAPSQK
jgi:membrane fusion protein (multidrug efflux system)